MTKKNLLEEEAVVAAYLLGEATYRQLCKMSYPEIC